MQLPANSPEGMTVARSWPYSASRNLTLRRENRTKAFWRRTNAPSPPSGLLRVVHAWARSALCPLVAPFRHPTCTDECPLSGGKADMTRTGRYVG
jgi:hypothetical protein